MNNQDREEELKLLIRSLEHYTKELKRKYYRSESNSILKYYEDWATVIELCNLANRHIERLLKRNPNAKEWFDIGREATRSIQYGLHIRELRQDRHL